MNLWHHIRSLSQEFWFCVDEENWTVSCIQKTLRGKRAWVLCVQAHTVALPYENGMVCHKLFRPECHMLPINCKEISKATISWQERWSRGWKHLFGSQHPLRLTAVYNFRSRTPNDCSQLLHIYIYIWCNSYLWQENTLIHKNK